MQTQTGLRPCCTSGRSIRAIAQFLGGKPLIKSGVSLVTAQRCRRQSNCCALSTERHHRSPESRAAASISGSCTLWLISELPALAEQTDFSKGGFAKESYYVTLGLFLLSLPGAAFKHCPVMSQMQRVVVMKNQPFSLHNLKFGLVLVCMVVHTAMTHGASALPSI